MQRVILIGFFLLPLIVVFAGCSRERENGGKTADGQMTAEKQDASKDNGAVKDTDKGGASQAGKSDSHRAAAEALVGSWQTTFTVDEAAFQKFVDDNMLTEDLADSERARWNESSISIVFNSDRTCTFTEPDGNFYSAAWAVANVEGNRLAVTMTAENATKTASIVMNEDGDGFRCEFVNDDQYDYLPIEKPLVFTRD